TRAERRARCATGGPGMTPLSTIPSSATQLLAGKHALVTGGSPGICAALPRAPISHRAPVPIPRPGEARLARPPRGSWAPFVVGDVSDRASAIRTLELASTSSGCVDILVNNAGQALSAPFLKTDLALWRRMLAVNLDGTFFFTQSALPAMLKAGWGRIVNIA